MYKRLGSLSGPDDRAQLERELLDRYGPPPPAVLNLLEYGILKAAAGRLRIRSIERKRDAVNVKFDEGAAVDPMRLMEFVSSRPGAQFTPAGVLHLPSGNGASAALLEVKQLLASLG
jgi:transcription-repair coupling factor (superfamily II helicase)